MFISVWLRYSSPCFVSKFSCSKRRDHLQDLGIDRMILEWILKQNGAKLWTRFIWPRTGTQWHDLMNTVMNLQVS